jgi:hypothetical protein
MGRSWRNIDHDPEIDRFKTLWLKERLKEKDLAVLAGLNHQTVHRMFDNQTKRPQHITYAKLAKAMGYEYALTRETMPNYSEELPQAHDDYKKHLADLKKKREQAHKKNGK